MDYPVRLPNELREYLRALRKEQGLTQAALGALLGVSQARIAEIESNPAVVSVEQLLRLLSALHASLIVRDKGRDPQSDATALTTAKPRKGSW
jgi:HTH-type transcriptional regulator/antitoxin HipB